jgi:hypothetical protein
MCCEINISFGCPKKSPAMKGVVLGETCLEETCKSYEE